MWITTLCLAKGMKKGMEVFSQRQGGWGGGIGRGLEGVDTTFKNPALP